jgi:hypothetical protein
VVNINTPAPATPVPAALVNLDRYITVYTATGTANGAPITHHPLENVGHPVGLNFFFTNTGNAVADDMEGYAALYIAAGETEKTLTDKFRKTLSHLTFAKSQSLETGGKFTFWFTGGTDRNLTQDDVDKLSNATERLYVFVHLGYRDATGKHYQHYCWFLQPPRDLSEEPIWHYCDDFTDHR